MTTDQKVVGSIPAGRTILNHFSLFYQNYLNIYYLIIVYLFYFELYFYKCL